MNHENNHEMNHKTRREMRRGNTTTATKILYATLASGGIAALMTYWFAPKSWNKFTRTVKNAASDGWNQIQNSAEWVGAEAESLYNQAGKQAQTLYKAAETEAGVIYDAAGKAMNSAEAAIAGIPKDLQEEKRRVDASFEAGRKAYNTDGGDSASQKAAAAKQS